MFFNPLVKAGRASIDPNYKVLATAQLTITDQTDASNLAGNLTIVNGSKSQIYLTGAAQPFNPDWKMNNLVIRPYTIATNVYRGNGDDKYNPDLFDPKEYPNLENPGDINVNVKYIHDIKWYIRDSANNETLINVKEDNRFSHTWTYQDAKGDDIILNDQRTLVIKDNILEKDSIVSIVMKFSFNDPFADIKIPVMYEIQLNNISTGMGTSKAAINSLDGNSFYNADESQTLRFEAQYFKEGINVDLDEKLQSSVSNLKVEWFIKTNKGWTILDPSTQDNNDWNLPGRDKLYEIHRVLERDENGNIVATEKTVNRKGGTVLIITPGLIAGSDIIKLVVTDDEQSDLKSNALENVYDHSDPTQCYIHSSNGDKLYKGINTPGTNLTAMISYKGELLEDGDAKYDELFDYYWYRIDSLGDVIENIYLDESGNVRFIDTKDPNYSSENGFPQKTKRVIYVKPSHIDYKATFFVDILDKQKALLSEYRQNLLRSLPTEKELEDAKIIAISAGFSKYDNEEILNTAFDLRAYTIAAEENIGSILDNK